MTILRLSFFLSLCLLSVSCSKPDYTDSNGNSGKFSDHHGQWLIINYWATWCKPCIKEIPELNQFASSQQGSVVLFGVDYDQHQDEQLRQQREKMGITFPVLNNDPAAVLGYERPKVLPTTLVFNPNGQLHRTLFGPQTKHSLLQAISDQES